ncbi:MAG: hypothetical protein M3163_09765, partial [Actinomycetota bacterium]|nr:hypothetical protein [Actinomycetota bacterium]
LPGHGHFNPMLALAHGLTKAGHQVAFATAADFCPHIEQTGFAAFPSGLPLARQMAEARERYPDQDALVAMERFEQFVPRMLAGVAAPARAADLVPLVRGWKPDLVIHDETEFAGPVAAAAAGIPWADQSVGIMRPGPWPVWPARRSGHSPNSTGSTSAPTAGCTGTSTSTWPRPACSHPRSPRSTSPTRCRTPSWSRAPRVSRCPPG